MHTDLVAQSGVATQRRRSILSVLPVLATIVATGSLLLATSSQAARFVYGAVLTEAQEVPPTGSAAFGSAQFVIDTDANTVTYRLAYGGLSAAETASHIHGPADPGTNAGVKTALPAGNVKTGVWNYAEADEGDILAGKMYCNVHSGNFPGGEIRGQIVPLNAQIDGAQENPPVPTTASGFAVFSIDRATNTLSYYISYAGLSSAETAAHIHGTALPGTNAGVLVALPAGNPKVGTFNYPENMEVPLLEGQTYVNIHTSNFPGGEIRGQIVPIVIPIDNQQEVPPTGSVATGVGLICYDSSTDNLGFDFRVAGLSANETAAHIHGFAAPGQNAGVLVALPAGNRKIGVWNYGAANEADVFAGLTYFNIHTSNFPGGEIRGQIQGFPQVLPSAVDGSELPLSIHLAPNAPNPFVQQTTIAYSLDHAMPVQLAIYDTQGRKVRTLLNGTAEAGNHAVAWDGRDEQGRPAASGIYRYVLQTDEGKLQRPLTLIR